MFYKVSNAGKRGNLPMEAQMYKALALKPVGSSIKIEKCSYQKT